MALRIDDPGVGAQILAESRRAGISPDEVVRRALDVQRTSAKDRAEALLKFLEEEIWPSVPTDQLGKRLTKAEEEDLLGYRLGEF